MIRLICNLNSHASSYNKSQKIHNNKTWRKIGRFNKFKVNLNEIKISLTESNKKQLLLSNP